MEWSKKKDNERLSLCMCLSVSLLCMAHKNEQNLCNEKQQKYLIHDSISFTTTHSFSFILFFLQDLKSFFFFFAFFLIIIINILEEKKKLLFHFWIP